jgi:hypothetical protein
VGVTVLRIIAWRIGSTSGLKPAIAEHGAPALVQLLCFRSGVSFDESQNLEEAMRRRLPHPLSHHPEEE